MGGVLHKSIVALALGLLLCGMATAQVDLTARVSRDSALLGDTVSYSVIGWGWGGGRRRGGVFCAATRYPCPRG